MSSGRAGISFKISKGDIEMNREIKFRAWDKTYNLMNYKVQVGNTDYADKNYTCNSIWVDYGDIKNIGWMNADDKCIDLMQYTGLKDKNGVEIYEGDIVRVCNNNNGFFEVIFINAYVGGWVLKHKEERFLSLGARKTTDIEIIGNIHQNPELL